MDVRASAEDRFGELADSGLACIALTALATARHLQNAVFGEGGS